MSKPVEYVANSMRLYDLDDELVLSIATACGQHVRISAGFAQALMMNEDTAAYIRKHFQRQEKDAAEMFQFTA